MMASEVIRRLQELVNEAGRDVEVALLEDGDGWWAIDYHPSLELIGIPHLDGSPEELTIAIAHHEHLDGGDDPEPERRLKLVK